MWKVLLEKIFKIKKQFFGGRISPHSDFKYIEILPLCSAGLKCYCLITLLYYFCDWNIYYWEYAIYVISGSKTVDQVCFSPLIYVAEQTGSQVMLCLPFISNLAVTVTFCSSYLAREAYHLAALVEAGFTHWCTTQSSSLAKFLVSRCHESLEDHRAVWPVSKWLCFSHKLEPVTVVCHGIHTGSLQPLGGYRRSTPYLQECCCL